MRDCKVAAYLHIHRLHATVKVGHRFEKHFIRFGEGHFVELKGGMVSSKKIAFGSSE